MDRKEILESIQEQPSKSFEYEKNVRMRGDNRAYYISMLVSIAMVIIEYIMQRTVAFGMLTIVFFSSCLQYLFEGCKLRIVWEIVVGVISGIVAFFSLLGFIGGLM